MIDGCMSIADWKIEASVADMMSKTTSDEISLAANGIITSRGTPVMVNC